MNPIKQFIEESGKKFDEEFIPDNKYGDISMERYLKLVEAQKSFLLSQQLALVEKIKEMIEGKKKEWIKENGYTDFVIRRPHNLTDINYALTQGSVEFAESLLQDLTIK